MTTKRTRPDRRKAMTGKPPLNPKGRPQRKIEILTTWVENTDTYIYSLHVDNMSVSGDRELIFELEKAVTRNRKKPPKI